MAKTTTRFLSTLLEQINRKACTPEIITGAWHLAVSAKDVDAMAVIAAADNLPDEVLAAVMKRNEIPVAVSYLTREGLDIDERRARIRAEERAGVLAGVLESPSITNDDRVIIAAKLVAKPTRALAEATIADKQMPLDAVAVAMATLDTRLDSLTDQQRRDLRLQIDRVVDDPITAAKVATSVKSPAIIQRLLGHQPKITAEAFEAAFAAGVEPEIERIASGRVTPNSVYHVVRLLRPIIGEHGDYQVDHILGAIRRFFDDEHAAKIWTDLVGAARAAAMEAGSDYSSRLLLAAKTQDPEDLDQLVTDVLANQEKSLVEALVMNPALTLEQLQLLHRHVDEHLLVRRLPLVAGDEAQVAHIYCHALSYALRQDDWQSFPDRARGEQLVFDAFVKNWYASNSSYYSSETRQILSVLESSADKATLVERLPWGMVEDLSHYHAMNDLWQVVSTIQARHLGDDLKKWETAATLAEGFSGSTGELFYTAANL